MRLVGLFMYTRLWAVVDLCNDLLTHRADATLIRLRDGLQKVLEPFSTLDDLKIEQERLRTHLQRFEMHTRSIRILDAKFDQLRQQWFDLPPSP